MGQIQLIRMLSSEWWEITYCDCEYDTNWSC